VLAVSDRVIGGVSSFGLNGTIAHAILSKFIESTCIGYSLRSRPAWRRASLQPGDMGASASLGSIEAVRFQRRLFLWSEQSHPMLQRCLEQIGEHAIFRSRVASRLLNLVAEHVVHDRIVFPGAAYLEMARAACRVVTSSPAALPCLHAVFFLQPLVIKSVDDDDVALIECVLREGGTFEVCSGSEKVLQRGDAPPNCSGATSPAARRSERAEVAARRSQCVRACSVLSLYECFHLVGLQYGPAYHLLQRPWVHEQRHSEGRWQGACAQLQRRRRSAELLVHPAELDGALQLCATAAPAAESAGGARLPFAVDHVLLRIELVEAFAVRSRPAR